ncbi:MAG: hypothetical protein GX866_00225 [Firmicutes bacterium]|nr:hypothetical protein [Bacillota bacterium]
MRLAWVVYDALYKLLSKSVLIFIFIFLAVLCFFALAMSGYLDLSPPERDLYSASISETYWNSTFVLTQTLLTFFIMILAGLSMHGLFKNDSEQIYLTGGVHRLLYMGGRVMGIFLLIILLHLLMLLSSSAVYAASAMGNMEAPLEEVFAKLLFNSIFVSSMVMFLTALTRHLVIGFSPIFLYYLWVAHNSHRSSETMVRWLNRLLPIFTFSDKPLPGASPNLPFLNLTLPYGYVYVSVYLLALLFLAFFLYTRSEYK